MLSKSGPLLGFILTVLAHCPTALVAQTLYQPKLVNNKTQQLHDFPMGVLSATGRLSDGERAILVMDVGKDGVADQAGLLKGDRITDIHGQRPGPFSMKTDAGLAGPQESLARAIEQASAAPPYQLKLTVRREDQSHKLTLTVPAAVSFAKTFPVRCAKRESYLSGIARHLVEIQQKDGRWRPGSVVTPTFTCRPSVPSRYWLMANPPTAQVSNGRLGLSSASASPRSTRKIPRSVPRVGKPPHRQSCWPSITWPRVIPRYLAI